MKELTALLIDLVPVYCHSFLEVTISPKKFIQTLKLENDTVARDSIVFFSLSVAITILLQLPLLKVNISIWYTAALTMGLNILSLFTFSTLLYVAWKVVGGNASIKAYFVISAYLYSVLVLLLMPFLLFGLVMFKNIDPVYFSEIYVKHVEGSSFDPLKSNGVRAFGICLLVGLSVDFIWFAVAWGAYNLLNQLSMLKSFIAFSVFHISYILSGIFLIAISTLFY